MCGLPARKAFLLTYLVFLRNDILGIQLPRMKLIVVTVLCQCFFLNFMQFAISCFINFLRGLFTQSVVTKWVFFLKNSFRIYKFLNLFCNSLHLLLVLVSFIVRDAVDSKINRVFKTPPSAKCDSDGIGLESHICNFFSVARGKRRALELL